MNEIAAFVLKSSGFYEAINRNCPYYYLSSEFVALFTDHLPSCPSYIVAQVDHIERRTANSAPLTSERAEHGRDRVDVLMPDIGSNQGLTLVSTLSPYGLHVNRECFIVTVAMLPDTTIHLPTS